MHVSEAFIRGTISGSTVKSGINSRCGRHWRVSLRPNAIKAQFAVSSYSFRNFQHSLEKSSESFLQFLFFLFAFSVARQFYSVRYRTPPPPSVNFRNFEKDKTNLVTLFTRFEFVFRFWEFSCRSPWNPMQCQHHSTNCQHVRTCLDCTALGKFFYSASIHSKDVQFLNLSNSIVIIEVIWSSEVILSKILGFQVEIGRKIECNSND